MAKKTSDEKAQKAYGLVVIKEDAEKGFSKKFIDTQKIKKWGTILILVLTATLVFSVYRTVRLIVLNTSVESLKMELNNTKGTMDDTILRLQSENEDLDGKVKLLSDQMALEIAKNDEQAEQRIPTGLPVSGRVSILEENAFAEPVEEDTELSKENLSESSEDMLQEPSEEEEQEFLTIFGVQRGSIVMAAGDGYVMAINEETEYGTALWIDHGNGYQTVYYYDGKPKVKEKDEVLRGTLLFEVEQNNRRVGYQIIQDGYFINPLNLMAISG